MASNSTAGMLPLGQSTVPGGLELTMGLTSIAAVLCAFLTGILTVQVYHYFMNYGGDRLWIKLLVALVCILDLGQLFSLIDFYWWYLVRNWGNLEALQSLRVSEGWTVMFGVLAVLAVQLMFLYRVYSLSKSLNTALLSVVPIIVLILIETAFGLRLTAFGFRGGEIAELLIGQNQNKYATGLWLGSGVAADILLSLTLCRHLWVNKTGFKPTDNLITRLIAYSINTCLLTSTVAVIDMICYFTMPDNNIHLLFNTLLGKLFSNSLLSSLNMRKSRRSTLSGGQSSSNYSGSENVVRVLREQHTDSPLPGPREQKGSVAKRTHDVQMQPLHESHEDTPRSSENPV